MDYIKYSILAGLAVVSYLLLLAWQEDFPAVAPVAVNESVSSAEVSSDIPVSIPSQVSVQDIPVVNATGPVITDSSISAANTLITVSTDVLNVTIDRLGGDIVYISLPEHLTRLESPDEPFVLLENTGNRTYVAQSGLIGANGIDNTQRPLYSASATTSSVVC